MSIAIISHEAFLNDPDAPYARLLRDAGFEIAYPEDPTFSRGRDEDETIRVLRGASALLAGGDCMTKRVIDALPELRVIARGGVGYDRVDVRAATSRRVAVTITPFSIPDAVAEHAFALLLAVARNIALQDRTTRAGGWSVPPSRPLRGATLGLVGLGRIGRGVALRARGFEMKTLASDPFADVEFAKKNDIELVDFDALLERSDYVSLHAPSTAETTGLLNRETISKMKTGSVLINTARGELVVERDLVEALESGHLGGAGLDVYETEPVEPDSPLLKLDNVVLTPHKSSHETLARQTMALEAAQCIVELYRGSWPDGCVVNHELKEGWTW